MRVRRSALLLVPLVGAIAVAGCERAPTRRSGDTAITVIPPPVDSAPPIVRRSGWDQRLGPVLLVPGEESGVAHVVFAELLEMNGGTIDSLTVRDSLPGGTPIDLLGRGGRVGDASVVSPVSAGTAVVALGQGGCTQWPTTRLRAPGGAVLPSDWTVAFVDGTVSPMSLDSIGALARSDSIRLAAQVTRIAATLPNDTIPAFSGLPFFVRSARRFSPAPGVEAVIAELVRKVNQEASPLEEHLLIIAERAADDSAARYRVVHSDRAAGREDEVVTTEVLAAGSAGGVGPGGTAFVLLFRDHYEGGRYALLERTGAGSWRTRWRSLYTGC